MVNKCAAPKRKTGYQGIDKQSWKFATFYFPIKKADLIKQWIRFMNRINWEPTQDSVLCELHFKKHVIGHTQRCNLEWQLNPAPTNYLAELLKSTLSLPTP